MDTITRTIQKKLPNGNYMFISYDKEGKKYVNPIDYNRPKDWKGIKSRFFEVKNLIDNTVICFHLSISDKELENLTENFSLINVEIKVLK